MMTINISKYSPSEELTSMLINLLNDIESDIVAQTEAPKFMAQLTVAEILSSIADNVRKRAISDAIGAIGVMSEDVKHDA